MANIGDTPPTGSWRKKHNILWVGSVILDKAIAPFGALGVVAGAKPAGTHAIGDTPERVKLWTKRKL